MGWLEGLLTGYADQQNDIRRDEAIKAEHAAAGEAEIYKALLNSKDEKIRGMAATGLIQGSQPKKRKSGFAGWMGEMEQNPIYPQLMKYIGNRPQTYLPDEPGHPPTLAQPTTSPTTGDQMATPQPTTPPPAPAFKGIDFGAGTATPPPAPPHVTFGAPGDRPTPPPQASFTPDPNALPPAQGGVGFEPEVADGQFTHPDVNVSAAMPPPPPPSPTPPPPTPPAARRLAPQPNIFPTAGELAADTAEGKSLGDTSGDIGSYVELFRRQDPTLTEQQLYKRAGDAVLAERLRAGGRGQAPRSIMGQTTDASGQTHMVFRAFDPSLRAYVDPATQQPDPNFRPVSSVGTGQYFEQAAIQAGYDRGSMVPEWEFPRVQAMANELQQKASQAGGTGTALAKFNAPATVGEAQAQGRPVGSTSAQYQGGQPQAPPTPAERKALAYYTRGQQAVDSLTTPDAQGSALETRINQQNLLRQYQGASWVPNPLQTADQQQYRAAQRAFTEARLRLESGAAVPLHEVENDAKVYFAVPGDDPATLARKQAARAQVLAGLAYDAGSAYTEYFGQPFVAPLSNAPNGAPAAGPPPPPPAAAAPPPAAAAGPPAIPAPPPGGDVYTMVGGVLYKNGAPYVPPR